jgi:putative DNA primase/helicase
MTTAANYDDVITQLQDFGLEIDGLDVGRIVRCRVNGSRNRTGWYMLNELAMDSGDRLLVGAYGDWREGADPATGKPVSRKIELKKQAMTPEESAAIKKRIAEDRRKAELKRRATQKRVSERAQHAWRKFTFEGESPYLKKKQVGAHGVKFSDKGNLVIPLMDTQARVWGVQVIYSDPALIKKKGRDKTFWPTGLAKRGHFHVLGSITGDIILVAEGYATAASLHEATGLPVIVGFDAGNLMPVCEEIRKKHKHINILVCADDDFKTEGNPGVRSATTAAFAVGGEWVQPTFADRGERKLTDFNDLHVVEGLAMVASQIREKINQLGWGGGRAPARRNTQQGGGEGGRLRAIQTFEELSDRFVLVYGHKQTVFDRKERMLLSLSDMRDACTSREIHRRWSEDPGKEIVRIREVGFDPGEKDPDIICNLWGGWPTAPEKGTCERILELLEYICGEETNKRDVYQWVLKWLAYPIQNPGAKMRTSLVVHGGQGVGKNLFFETYMAIFGEYGRIIDQTAIEDKFNDWASKKLFLIADEVVARQELFHVKNKLKSLITSDWIRINPKNVTAYDERNHVNLVFLSNEIQPTVLEKDDRRHLVIWTPPKLPQEIYTEVKDELCAGGAAALHHYLLNLDLGDFNEYTQPPMTRAKEELIGISIDSTQRFWEEWVNERIDHVPVIPCKTDDFYTLYKEYCRRIGYNRYAPEPKLLAEISKRTTAQKIRSRYLAGQTRKFGTFIIPPGAEKPDDVSKESWLSDSIEKFRNGIQHWKEDAAGANSGGGF